MSRENVELFYKAVERYVGCIVIRPDGSRTLARAEPDPLEGATSARA